MITFPCAKINLGLNIVGKRADGYHELQTVFYPLKLTDSLKIECVNDNYQSETRCELNVSGIPIVCTEQNNLVVKAYNLIAKDYVLPRIHTHLCKNIPSQAGLGGGSSDATYMIRLLNKMFNLNMGSAKMERYAMQLGADCAFFVTSKPKYATGIGEIMTPINYALNNLDNFFIGIVKPAIAVSTQEAFTHIRPKTPKKCCNDIIYQSIDTWRDELTNDFEKPIFAIHPELKDIKSRLYNLGAIYAQMSGSGSTIFGIFNKRIDLSTEFKNMFTFFGKL